MSTSLAERTELRDLAHEVAAEAASLVLRGWRSRPHVDKKGRADLVTDFDRASEDRVLELLGKRTPEIPVIGEERGGDRPDRSGLRWYIDPIDGTTNFVHGHPFWCVSLGLAEDDEPVAGAVVAPALATTWLGVRDPRGGGLALRSGEACRVSRIPALEDALVATGFPTDRSGPDNNFDTFVRVKLRAQAVRRCGSAALDLCLVADGTYEAYWERRLHAWDTMAGAAIGLAAGAHISSFEGGAPDYHRGRLLASNGLVHEELRAILLEG